MNSSPLLRRGVTLLELLVVLLLLGITAALVLPALAPRLASRPEGADGVAGLVASARRQAIRRAESLKLRVDRDGIWALVSARDGAVVDGGRIPLRGAEQGVEPTELTIDALGSCMPSGSGASASSAPRRFDPMSCAPAVATRQGEGA